MVFMRGFHGWLLVATAAVFCLIPLTASAGSAFPAISNKTPDKVAPLLRQLARHDVAVASDMEVKLGPGPEMPADSAGRLLTYLYLDTPHLMPTLRQELASLAVQIDQVNEDWRVAQAWVPPDQLDAVAGLPGIKRLAPADTPYRQSQASSGSINSAGDAILKADQVRARGFSGAGVPVGVISDSASQDSIRRAQANGDLANVTVLQSPDGTDEGTASLEIVHDLAPGAPLGFFGPSTSLEMSNGVSRLANEFGAKVMVDDLFFPGEPWFEDGPMANSIRSVITNKDVLYASAAGNYRQAHYLGQFQGNGPAPVCNSRFTGRNLNLFPNGATRLIFHHTGGPLRVFLQWANPFADPHDDYDLYLCDESGSILISVSNAQQGPGIGNPPLEYAAGSDAPPGNYSIVVDKHNGSDVPLELIISPNTATILAGQATYGDAIIGQAALAEVLATAAIGAQDPGHAHTEYYSEMGPAHIYFPSYQERPKPDVAAIDGVHTTLPNFAMFYGTSAAAPHVAGVAALLRQAAPGATAGQMRDVLRRGAADIESPGFDFSSGYGRVDALASFDLLAGLRSAVAAYIEQPGPGHNTADSLSISGYAIDLGAREGATGVDRVDVYLDGPFPNGRGLGVAEYGISRPDVSVYFGNQRWLYSGWRLTVDAKTIRAGRHTLYAYARSTLSGQFASLAPVHFANFYGVFVPVLGVR